MSNPIEQTLDSALAEHRAGRLQEAERLYREALRQSPSHPQATHLLGAIAAQTGRLDLALQLMRRSVELSPWNASYLFNYGAVLQQAGQSDAAIQTWLKTLELEPTHVEALNNIGGVLARMHRFSEAIGYLQKSMALNPASPMACCNLGQCFAAMGRLEDARLMYLKAISLDAGFADAHFNLGNLHRVAGRPAEAMAEFQRVAEIRPDHADACVNLGAVLEEMGRADDAIAAWKKALSIRPDYAEVHSNLSSLYYALGRSAEAVAAARKAIALKPEFVPAHLHLANALQATGQSDAAAEACRRAIALEPGNAYALVNLGNILQEQSKPDEAVAVYRQAMKLAPNYPETYSNLGNLYASQGKLSSAIDCYAKALALRPTFATGETNLANALGSQGRQTEALIHAGRAVELDPSSLPAASNLLLTLHYDAGFDPVSCFQQHLAFARRHAEPLAAKIAPHRNSRDPQRKLRIGYVSPDFRDHPVSFFVEALLAGHNREQFHIMCYSDVQRPNAVTERLLRLADGWRSFVGVSDQHAAEQVRKDQIDILVDLAGHTANNRMGMFARKPAPVQVTYLGYPDTTGLATMDYRLTDAVADPPWQTERYHSEKLIRLPNCFLCYAAPPDSPDVAPLPCRQRGHVTFGSFNNLAKVTPVMLDHWAAILRAVPTSRLMIKARGLADEPTRQILAQSLTSRGVPQDRFELLAQQPGLPVHLAHYHRVDIALDTYPYTGATTTCEALWMGVPVITLAGPTHLSRVSASLLTAIGLPELIADSPEKYVAVAASLAGDVDRLERLRSTMRDRMRASPLLDRPAFVTGVESAYRQMWLAPLRRDAPSTSA